MNMVWQMQRGRWIQRLTIFFNFNRYIAARIVQNGDVKNAG